MDNKEESLLTTKDNPFNPFTEFKDWYTFDVSKGYHTVNLLARIAKSSDELSDADQVLAFDSAIQSILAIDYDQKYIVVTASSFKKPIQ